MASSIRKAAAAAAVAGVSAALGALALYLPYETAFRSPHRGQNEICRLPEGEQYLPRGEEMKALVRALMKEPYEWVTVENRDGLRLTGRLYRRGGKDAPVDLCFHGWRGTGVRDFGGGALYLLGQGHNVLIVDQRAQGDSQGHTMTFGVWERYDVLTWLEFVESREDLAGPVTLYGVSMGASTVLLASALDLPERVTHIVADSPYSSPAAILEKVSRDMGLPGKASLALLRGGAALFGGFAFDGVSCVEAVKHTQVPILLIHGEEDRFVPIEMSREIAAANPAMVKLVTFPEAAHGISYVVDPERYTRELGAFLQEKENFCENT